MKVKVLEKKKIETVIKVFGYLFGITMCLYLSYMVKNAIMVFTLFPFSLSYDLWILDICKLNKDDDLRKVKWISTTICILCFTISLIIKNPEILF